MPSVVPNDTLFTAATLVHPMTMPMTASRGCVQHPGRIRPSGDGVIGNCLGSGESVNP